MVEAIFLTLLMWVGFIFISALVVLIAFVGAYYGLKLIDATERWYKGTAHDKSPK